jgi:hypothetical protein
MSSFEMDPRWYNGETIPKDDEWYAAARDAAERGEAFNIREVVILMSSDGFRITIEDMDDWCKDARHAYPCLFRANVVSGIGPTVTTKIKAPR